MGCGAMGDEVNMVPEASCCDSCCAAIATGCLLLCSLGRRPLVRYAVAAEKDGVFQVARKSCGDVENARGNLARNGSFLLKKLCSFETWARQTQMLLSRQQFNHRLSPFKGVGN